MQTFSALNPVASDACRRLFHRSCVGFGRALKIPACLLGLLLGHVLAAHSAVDLVVRQSFAPATVGVGTNLTYTIIVTNVGNSAATSVALTNPLPPGMNFISVSTSQGSCSNVSGTVRCSLGNLAAAGRATVTVVGRSVMPGTKTNTVSAGSAQVDANPADNSFTTEAPVLLFHPVFSNPLAISLPELDSGPADIFPSVINVSGLTTTVYRVTVTLHNISHAFPDDLDVLLVEPGGAGILLMSDAGGDGALSGVTLTFDDAAAQPLPDSALLGPLTSGAYRPGNFGFEDFFAAPAPPGPYGPDLEFFEAINPNGAWSLYVMDDLAEDAGAISGGWSMRLTTIEPFSDLAVTAVAAPDPVLAGSNLTYTATVTNRGPSVATSVTVFDNLPAGVEFVSATTTLGSCSNFNGEVTCRLGTMTNRATATITLIVRPTIGGVLFNYFEVTSVRDETEYANNFADVFTTVRLVSDLALSGTVAPEPVLRGELLTYSLRVTNLGISEATGVMLQDPLPAGLVFVGATSSQGGCGIVSGTVQCALGTITSGGGATVTLSLRANNVGVVSNHFTVSAFEADGHPADNTLALLSTVIPAADLVLRQTDAPDPALRGQMVTYSVTISNRGPSIATGVLVTNLVPELVDVLSISNSQGTCSQVGRTIRCNLGSLAVGAQAFLIVVVRANEVSVLTNSANAVAIEADPDPANSRSSAVTVVHPGAELLLQVVESADPHALGAPLTYTLSVSNQGPSSAGFVDVVDNLPPGVAFVSATPSQGSCAHLNGTVTCELGTVLPGDDASINLVVMPNRTGTITNRATVTSVVSDPITSNNVRTNETLVLVAAGFFSNGNPVAIPAVGAANPYPSTIFVSGITVRVDSVTVTLSNIHHANIDDLDILLVGPSGQTAVLMSDVGGNTSVSNLSLSLSDVATGFLPDTSGLVSGPYRPANYGPAGDSFPAPAPAPAPSYGTNLGVFRTLSPNGTWSLYLVDDTNTAAGALAGGWSLSFATSTELSDVAVLATDIPDPVAVTSNLIYSITVTNQGPSIATNVVVTNRLSSGATFISATSTLGSCTQNLGVVTCNLGTIAFRQAAIITLVTRFAATGTYSNHVQIRAQSADPNLANNAMSALTTVRQFVVITSSPPNRTISAGAATTFDVTATGALPFSYQWRHNGLNIVGANASSYTLSNARFADGGNYTVLVSNDVSTRESVAAVLSVLSAPEILFQPQSRTNFAGGPTSFSVTAVGTLPLTYQWFFNETNALLNATNPVYTINVAQKTNNGTYLVLVTNQFGQSNSVLAALTILEADFGDAPQPSFPTQLANNGAYHLITPGLRLGTAIDFESNGRTNSTATGDDNAGADDEDGVRFATPLLIGRTSMVEVVASAPGFLNAWLDWNANRSWADVDEQIFTDVPLVAGTNQLTVIVPGNATLGASFGRFRFSSTGGLSFAGPATDGEVEDHGVSIMGVADLGISVTDLPDPVALGGNLTYTILVTNRGPSRATVATVSATVPNSASYVSASTSRGSCGIQSGTVMCSIGSMSTGEVVTVTVIVTPSVATTLSSTATVSSPEVDINPADNSATTLTLVGIPPGISSSPQNQTVSLGGTATFGVTANGSMPLRYQWFQNTLPLSGRTNNPLVITNIQAGDAGNYNVQVSNDVGSAPSTSAQLRIEGAPIALTQPATSVASTGVVLRATVNPHGLATTYWFEWGTTTGYGNTTVVLAAGAGLQVISVNAPISYGSPTTYHFRVVATNSLGRRDGSDLNFAWQAGPVPTFVPIMTVEPNRIHMEFTGADEPDHHYIIEASDDLVLWQAIDTATHVTGNRFSFEENRFRPGRFYRILSP